MAIDVFVPWISGTPTGTTDDGGLNGYSFRSVCTTSATTLGQVRVTFKAHSAATCDILHASIGVGSGSIGSITGTFGTTAFNELDFTGQTGAGSGGHGFTISSGATITSNWLTFDTVTSGNTLVVIIDMGANGNLVLYNGNTNGTSFFSNSLPGGTPGQSYSTATDPGFTANTNVVRMVSRIETQAGATATTLMGAICL